MARKVTVKAFEEWVKVEANVAGVLERIAGGLTLQRAAVAVKQPYTCLHGYFHSTPELVARYDAARKSWADRKMDEALEIADGVRADRDAVAKAKLRVDTRHNQAKAYNRDRWGEHLQVEKSVTVSADAALVGFAADLLMRRRPAVLENEVELIAPGQVSEAPLGADSPSVALPAPAEMAKG